MLSMVGEDHKDSVTQCGDQGTESGRGNSKKTSAAGAE